MMAAPAGGGPGWRHVTVTPAGPQPALVSLGLTGSMRFEIRVSFTLELPVSGF
jgi:hypothetical protein